MKAKDIRAMDSEAMAGALTWAGCSRKEPTRGGRGFLAMAIKIESFVELEIFEREMQYLIEWVKSSPRLPGVDRIYVPGEIEARARETRLKEGIEVEDATWDQIKRCAEEFHVPIPTPLSS